MVSDWWASNLSALNNKIIGPPFVLLFPPLPRPPIPAPALFHSYISIIHTGWHRGEQCYPSQREHHWKQGRRTERALHVPGSTRQSQIHLSVIKSVKRTLSYLNLKKNTHLIKQFYNKHHVISFWRVTNLFLWTSDSTINTRVPFKDFFLPLFAVMLSLTSGTRGQAIMNWNAILL